MKLITIIILFQLSLGYLYPCTMFTKTENGRTLIANNEDWKNPYSKIWFKPANDNKYGAVYFGEAHLFPQSGINEEGLVIDYFYVYNNRPKPNGKKTIKRKASMETILETCSTVKEALSLLDQYDPSFIHDYQIMIADKNGDSAIYEGESIIRKKDSYQIVTNFKFSEYGTAKFYPCKRYNTVNKMLKNNSISISNFAKILERVKSTGLHTIYSYIIDPKQNKIYLYHYHDFKNPYIIDIKKELKKGYRILDMHTLFKNKVYDKFQKDYLSKKPQQIKADESLYKEYAGKYYFEGYEDYNIITKNNKLFYKDSIELEMLPMGKHKYFFEELDHIVTFKKDRFGNFTKLTWENGFHGKFIATKKTNYRHYITGATLLLIVSTSIFVKLLKSKRKN